MMIRHGLKRIALLSVIPTAMNVKSMSPSDTPASYVKVKDLPLYKDTAGMDEDIYDDPSIPSLQRRISVIRKFISSSLYPLKSTADEMMDMYQTGRAHTLDLLEYVRSDPALLTRVGVISVASLGGVIAGYRGGALRKLAYGSFSGLSVAAVCYPKEAVEVAHAGGRGFMTVTGIGLTVWNNVFPMTKPGWEKFAEADKQRTEPTVTSDDAEPRSEMAEVSHEDHGQSRAEDGDLYTTRTS